MKYYLSPWTLGWLTVLHLNSEHVPTTMQYSLLVYIFVPKVFVVD